MKRSIAKIWIMLFSLTLMIPSKVYAECNTISKSRAIAMAQKRVKGKVLSATLSKRGGQQTYKVKLLMENGRVKTVSINACAGGAAAAYFNQSDL